MNPPKPPFRKAEVRLRKARLTEAIKLRNADLLFQADVDLAAVELRKAAGCICGAETRCLCGRIDRARRLK